MEQSASNEVEAAGRFRIYLGAMAGVGKTCAMLDEGWRRMQRGADVVIGLVETHGRVHTQELIREIPVIPQRVVTYQGRQFMEMDTAAVVARHPDVVLVDELAHTNIPGSGPHEKRYEDVLDLLNAGIDVIATLNVQHIESIAGAVEEMLGVRISERVPDWVVRQADQLELIDSSPQQLRRRMLHGNIYPESKIQSALDNFFTTQNLTALRELALRFVADEADEDLLLSFANRQGRRVFETRERYLVGLSLSPETPRVLRRAARMAARSKADLRSLLIMPDTDISESASREIEALRKLSHDLGVVFLEKYGTKVADVMVETALEHQITQIVIGASKRSRRDELLKGSIVNQVLRKVGPLGIDVHVIGIRDYDPGLAEIDDN
ncbi:universal stress protein [Ferrimicrobium sp.]|uniref:universal stress protein n=1 Tax=Ferrimicrobium sp. TaxID=2926050 RepID=UPI002637D291|nr:universal stress protein [Ferrimicrobium sp.]